MFKDLRYAFRMLRKNPGFAAVAICSLAIGIGANSAIYSFADGMLLRPLAVAEPSRVVTVNGVSTGTFGASNSISYPDYVDLRDRNHTFEGLVATAYASFGFGADRDAQPRRRIGMLVSGNFFKVLGVTLQIGRSFRAEEDMAPAKNAVVVLSHDLWESDFNGNPAVAGRTVWLNGTEFTIIGVAPETFKGLSQLKPALYVPLAMSASLGGTNNLEKRDVGWLDVKGRLKSTMGIAQARADVDSIASALRSMYPKSDQNLKLKVETEFQLRAERSPPDTALIVMLSVLAACVLLVACANVTGLLLSRSTMRVREIALRLAVGASRSSLIRQLMLENLLLALAGGAVGLVVAMGAVAFFNTLPMPTDIPLDLSFRLDDRALLFTLGAAIFSTFLFGLTPAFGTTRVDLIQALKERDGTASRGSRLWGRNLIVGGQVALSLVLLIVSAVLVDGFRAQLEQGPGFRTDHLQLMSFDPNLAHYSEPQRELFYKQLLDKVRLAPEVASATLTSSTPMSPSGPNTIGVVPEGHTLKRGEEAPLIFDSVVSPDYFRTMAIAVVQGRSFQESDKMHAPLVAIVNEHFARHYWPKQSAIGKQLRLKDAAGKVVQVVGVARMSKYLWITESPSDYLYLPFAQNPQPEMVLAVQSKNADAATLQPVLRQIVQSLDRNMPVFEVRTMKDLYASRAVATPNMISRTVTGLGVMGLVLSVIGLYGVVSYSVSKRSREFGIRMAVGADRHKVMGMVLKQSLVLGICGLTVGLVAGILVTRALTSQLMFSFELRALPFLVVSLALLLTIALAGYSPARRASLIDPMRSLREE
jgi:macrolide transport system ATP-binding/permease protein